MAEIAGGQAPVEKPDDQEAALRREFAQRLRGAMERAGLKQADLIRLAGARGRRLGKSQVSQYVSGKTLPRPDVMRLLAIVLDVDSGWLSCDIIRRDPLSGEVVYTAPARATSGVPAASRSGAPASPAFAGSMASPSATAVATPTTPEGPSSSRPAVSNPGGSAPLDTQGSAPMTSNSVSPTASANDASSKSASSGAPASSTTAAPCARAASCDSAEPVAPREFTKAAKLAHVQYDVRGPVADAAAKMEAQGLRVLKLNIGNPAPFGFRTPDEVVQDMARQLTDCEGYSDTKGLFHARKAIMQYAQLKGLPNVGMDDIYTGNGVSELINLTMTALLDHGDEILIPAPDYPLWTACASLAGGTPVHYLCDEQADWNPDIADIERKITPRTKAIVIINPNNPTGAVYSREVLEEIVEIARRHQLIIFSDEIYDRLVMDGIEHVSIASLAPDLFCITFSGLSKSHMIAGWRIGWMIMSGNKDMAKDYIAGLHLLSNMRLCSNVPAQSIVQTALGGHQSVKDYIRPGGRIYEQREYVYQALNDIPGISAVKPKAAFYIFPKMDIAKFNIRDDEKFAMDLLREKRILITRGRGFNWPEPDHFRIVYLPRIDALREAMGDLGDFFAHYRQR